jgi:hypothetical protein
MASFGGDPNRSVSRAAVFLPRRYHVTVLFLAEPPADVSEQNDRPGLWTRLVQAWKEELLSEETVVEASSVVVGLTLVLTAASVWRPVALYALFPAVGGPGLAAYELRRIGRREWDRKTSLWMGSVGPVAGTGAFVATLTAGEAVGIGTETAALGGALTALIATVIGIRLYLR